MGTEIPLAALIESLERAVGGNGRGAFGGSLQCEPNSLVVELVTVLLKGDLNSGIIAVELDLVRGHDPVCAIYFGLPCCYCLR